MPSKNLNLRFDGGNHDETMYDMRQKLFRNQI